MNLTLILAIEFLGLYYFTGILLGLIMGMLLERRRNNYEKEVNKILIKKINKINDEEVNKIW